MKVLIVGSGGREHALAWKLKQSPKIKQIYCAPGNGGIAQIAGCVDIAVDDIEGLVAFAKKESINITVVGPEAPLVNGIVNEFEKEDLMIFGPSREAAQLEGSKIYAKEFMHRWNIPTATFKIFTELDVALQFLNDAQFPLVIKADGLAAGKGVYVCARIEEAQDALHQIMKQKVFKAAGNRIVIEECLDGQEASIMAISDGEQYIVLAASQDHKRIFDDDLGPNTGGMGAYCPAPIVTRDVLNKVEARIIEPAIRGMFREGIPFKGVLYAGLMITADGPKALEFNVRFGDPEIQAVLPRLQNDLVDIFLASCNGHIETIALHWDPRACVCVVMSSGGYPGEYEKGKKITGLASISEDEAIVFHAGTKLNNDHLVTNGGRVLGVTGLGKGLEEAVANTYKSVERIKFERCFFRRDIGAKALKRAKV